MRSALVLACLFGPAALAQGAPQAGLANEGVIAGQVCADLDLDGQCGADEPGVAGARVVLETGLTAITDRAGRFHFAGVGSQAADALGGGRLLPGRHRLRIDVRYLPGGTRSVPDGVTAEVPMGGLAQVTFALQSPRREEALRRGGQPPRGELEHDVLKYRIGGQGAPGDAVEVAGKAAEVSPDGSWGAWVVLATGANRLPITVRAKDGRVAFFEKGYEVVRREGGLMVIPRGVRPGARVELPAAGLEGAAARVVAPAGTKVSVDAREVVVGEAGTANLVLAAPGEGGYRISAQSPGLLPFEARSSGAEAFSVSAVGLLDLELTLDTQRWSPRLFGRGAGTLRARAFGFDFAGELDLRDTDLQGALDAGGATLLAPRRLDVFDRQTDLVRSPVRFGDDSATIDSNPSEARFRLEVSRAGLGRVGWGSKRAWLADAEVGRYHRGLTGAFFEAAVGKDTAVVAGRLDGWYAPTDGDPVLGLRRAPGHDQFASIGGSVYWLAHGGVVAGSELVRVELRDGVTGFPTTERHLVRGRDYAIDAVSGRLLLADPLAMFGGPGAFLTDAPGASAAPVLVVDYEYTTLSAASAQFAGGAGELRLGPVRISVGGAWEQAQYGLVRGRVLAPLGPVTLSGEVACSTGLARGVAWSDDGGLGFLSADAAEPSADFRCAFGARARGRGLFGRGTFDLAWRRRNAGFSDAEHAEGALFQQFTARVEQPLGPIEVLGVFDDLTRADSADPFGSTPMHGRVAGGGVGFVQPRWGVRLEARDTQVDLARTEGEGGRLSVGLNGHFAVNHWLTLVAGYRQRVWSRGDGPGAFDDSFGQVGADVRVSEAAQFGVRGGWGPGLGPQVWGTAQVKSGEDTWYGGHALDADGPSAGEHRYVSGVRRQVSEGGAVFVEDVAAHDATAVRLGRAIGLSQDLPGGFRLGARYERGWKEGFESAQARVRDVGGLSVAWTSSRVRLFARGEVRSDRDGPAPGVELEVLQALAMAGGEAELPAGFGATARVQWQHTTRAGQLAARLLEGVAAISWRHRLATVILRYAMQRELLPPSRGGVAEKGFHLVSLLPSFRLHDRVTVGAGLHATFAAVEGDSEVTFAASLRPAVRIWQGIEVAGEIARRSQASDGGELTAVRAEAGYRFAENFFLGAGYTLFGFSGLGLNDGTPESRNRLYLRAEAAW